MTKSEFMASFWLAPPESRWHKSAACIILNRSMAWMNIAIRREALAVDENNYTTKREIVELLDSGWRMNGAPAMHDVRRAAA
jgi:hypothetical protein